MSQVMFYILTFFAYILNTFVVFWYCHRLFDYKKDFKTSLFICFGANIVLWLLLNIFFSEVINITAIFILFTLVLLLGFDCDWKLAIFNSLLLVAIMWISEYMILFFVTGVLDLEANHYENDLIIFLEETFATRILYFVLLTIISTFSKKNTKKEGLKTSLYLTILPVTSCFLTLVLRTQSHYFEASAMVTTLCVLSELLLFIANIVVFSVHEKTIVSQQKIHDIEMVEQKQTINLEYLDILERKDEETRIFIHDIRNNLVNIGNLTNEESVKDYIQNIYDKSNEISIKAKTKNRLLDVIINKYALVCKDKQIKFNTLSLNENLSFVSNYDLTSILDNLLNNAVESAQKEANPYIELVLESDNKFHKIIIKNSCSTHPKEYNNNLVTTKTNKSIHGYGLKSVTKALSNYNGELEWAYTNNEFKIIILIPLQQK